MPPMTRGRDSRQAESETPLCILGLVGCVGCVEAACFHDVADAEYIAAIRRQRFRRLESHQEHP